VRAVPIPEKKVIDYFKDQEEVSKTEEELLAEFKEFLQHKDRQKKSEKLD